MDSNNIPPLEALAAMMVKHEAADRALHKIAVELMMQVTGRPFDVCNDALTESERVEHQKFLEELESVSPALAALLDKRDPEHLPESD
jgi:hypothetical protein